MRASKIISMILTAAMVLSLIPAFTLMASAVGENIFYVGTGTQWQGKATIYTEPQAAINDAKAWATTNGTAYVLVAVGTESHMH